MTRQIDLEFRNEGSFYLVIPFTSAAKDWIEDNLDPNAQRWCGGVVVEHRYADAILIGAQDDGLRVG